MIIDAVLRVIGILAICAVLTYGAWLLELAYEASKIVVVQ